MKLYLNNYNYNLILGDRKYFPNLNEWYKLNFPLTTSDEDWKLYFNDHYTLILEIL